MTNQTRSRAHCLLSRMPGLTPWTEDEAQLYDVALDSIPPLLIPEVIHRALATCTYRPSVRELLTIASEMLAGPHPTTGEAWHTVERLMMTRGIYCRPDPYHENVYREGAPVFPHAFIERAVERMGGWRSMCLSDMDMGSIRAQFQRAYDEVLEEARRKNCDALASGHLEDVRQYRGARHGKPRLRLVTGG